MNLDANKLNIILKIISTSVPILRIVISLCSRLLSSKTIYYSVKTTKINKEDGIIALDGITQLYNIKDADKINSISTICLWTDNKHQIQGSSDIDTDCLPSITIRNGGLIFAAKILMDNDKPDFIKASYEVRNNTVLFNFKQLDYDHGLTFQIIHSGITSSDVVFNSNMNVKHTRKLCYVKVNDIKILGIIFLIFDLICVLMIYNSFITLPSILFYLLAILYLLIVIITLIYWLYISIKQVFFPLFVRNAFKK